MIWVLLERLTKCAAPSGRESALCDILKAESEKFADEVYTDALGNLIVHKKGHGKKIMLAAHCDEIGVAVTFIDKNGYYWGINQNGGIIIFNLWQQDIMRGNSNMFVVGSSGSRKKYGSKAYDIK